MIDKTKLVTISVAFLLLGSCLAWGQKPTQSSQSSHADDDSAAQTGIQLSEPIESVWEFGVKVDSTGDGKQISVSVPIPREWPEQQLEVIAEDKTPNVGRFVEKDITKYARQFTYSVNRMSAGESASGLIRFKVKKSYISAPKDISQFKIAKKVPTKLKTFLKPSPFIESNHKRIKVIAKELHDDTLNGWDQVESFYKWVRKTIEYKFDVENRSCLTALDSGLGDCEELSATFIAICRASGIPARAVWVPGHTYPEFYLEDQSGEGHWFPCQAAGTYEFGSMSDAKPILQKGDRFRIPGQRKEVRYLRPTLTAREGAGLSIEWIARESEKKSGDSK